MSETKTYVFGENGNNNLASILTPLLQQRGIDPNLLIGMMNNGCGGFGGNGAWFIWVIFLMLLFRGNYGFNGDGNGGAAYLGNLINNDSGRDMLMQAIQNNGSRVGELANMLNCSIGDVRNAINAINTTLCNIGGKVDMSGMQVINAIQAGNASLASQLAQCCCENRLAICNQTNTLQQAINGVSIGQERGFASLGFETQKQTCDIRDAIRENTAQVLAGQRAAETREMQREIAERDRKIAEQANEIALGKQSSMFAQMIQSATTPLVAGINSLQADINNVKCKLPETVTTPYQPFVAVPNCVAAQYGLGFGFGLPGAWG